VTDIGVGLCETPWVSCGRQAFVPDDRSSVPGRRVFVIRHMPYISTPHPLVFPMGNRLVSPRTAALRRWIVLLLLPLAAAIVPHGIAAQATSALPAPPPAIAQIEYVARRDSLLAHVDSGVIVIPGGRDPVGHYPPFRQVPAFRYLTGFLEPDATLVMVKQHGESHAALYIEPAAPLKEFFTGTRIGNDEVTRTLGLGGRSNEDLNAALDSLAATHLPFYFVSDAESQEFIQPDSLAFGRALARRLLASHPGLDVRDGTPIEVALRARKSAAEVALLKRAAELSDLGHRAAMQALAPNMNEYQIQALMEYTFRVNGADRPGYASIVGSGPNSTTLHYDKDDRVMHAGEVLVMDVAAEYQGYSADETRTLPVSGSFTPDQRAIYQIVRDAQAAGERQVKPGASARAEVDSIAAVIAAGLTRLGLIDSAAATIDGPPGFCRRPDNVCPQRSLFYPHGPGHGIGLDVHDPAQFYAPPNTFGVGDVVTIEPGIYVRPSLIDVLPDTPRNRAFIARVRPLLQRFSNIGVRIEDDYVVTPTGVERLTHSPREIDEVEALMKHHIAARAAVEPTVGR
jgi:Xaa-Pro aminopeptidase